MCQNCNKTFASKQSCQNHQKKNVCCGHHPPVIVNDTSQTGVPICTYNKLSQEQLIAEIQARETQLHEQKNEIGQLKTEVRVLKENPQTVNNNNIIVIPPHFLAPDSYEHLMHNLPKLLPNALRKHATECVTYLIEQTNCNPDLPLYNSIKLHNKRDSYIQVSNGKKYVYKTKKEIIAELIENKRQPLTEICR